MGGAQPLAVTMNEGVAICVDCDVTRIDRRIEHRYLDTKAADIDDALRLAVEARDAKRPLSIGLLGNAAEVLPELLRRDAPIDIVTDQTSAHDPLSYLPIGIDFDDMKKMADKDPVYFTEQAQAVDGQARRGDGRLHGPRRRGVRLRQLHPRRGPKGRLRPGLRLPRLRPRLHPAAVRGGPRAVPVGGAVG